MITIYLADGEITIWFDPDGSGREGLCLGAGRTKEAALSKARDVLVAALAEVHSKREANRAMQHQLASLTEAVGRASPRAAEPKQLLKDIPVSD